MDLRKEIYFYANLAAFPATGALNCLYVASATGIIYTWNGSSYVASGPGPVPTGLNYQGLWNANANLPLITSSVGTVGNYYIVGTAGTTNINGINDWGVGDWIVFSSTGVWQKIDNSDLEGYNLIQDEGLPLPKESIIDFTGAGVTASAGLGKTIVNIPIQPAYATVQDEGTALPQRTVIDFQGGGVTASDDPINSKTIVSIVAASGRFGIADSNGAYTYYTTLSLAMAAATAGQTIEVFADYTETGSTEIFLKNGVNINGNGHTFTKNTNDGTAIFWMSVTKVDCSILNYNIVRSVGSGAILRTVGYADGTIDFSGTIFNKSGSGSGADFISVTVLNLTAYCSTSSTAISVNGTAQNCIGINTSSGVGFQLQSGTSQNCVGKSDSGIGFVNRGYSLNGSGYSNSGVGFQSESRAVNCVGRSVSGIGFQCYYDTVDNIDCVGISISGQGLSSQGGNCFGCSGYSTSNYGTVLTGGTQHCNFTSKSDGAPSIWAVNVNSSCRVIEGTAYSYWNNAAGYGLRGWGGVMPGLISNVFFKLSNASAPYLFNDNIATSLILRGNTYIGGTAYNPNITQAAVTTQDNQGNIFL